MRFTHGNKCNPAQALLFPSDQTGTRAFNATVHVELVAGVVKVVLVPQGPMFSGGVCIIHTTDRRAHTLVAFGFCFVLLKPRALSNSLTAYVFFLYRIGIVEITSLFFCILLLLSSLVVWVSSLVHTCRSRSGSPTPPRTSPQERGRILARKSSSAFPHKFPAGKGARSRTRCLPGNSI